MWRRADRGEFLIWGADKISTLGCRAKLSRVSGSICVTRASVLVAGNKPWSGGSLVHIGFCGYNQIGAVKPPPAGESWGQSRQQSIQSAASFSNWRHYNPLHLHRQRSILLTNALNFLRFRALAGALWRLGIVFLALTVVAATRAAAAESITVVLTDDGPIYREVAEALRRGIERDAPGRFRISTIDAEVLKGRLAELHKSDAGLLVTVGVRAAMLVGEADPKLPVLYTLLPRAAYDKVRAGRAAAGEAPNVSAIYLEQPAARSLDLVRIAVPKGLHVGMIFGPDSMGFARNYGQAAELVGLKLESETVATAEDIPRALDRLLARCDVLLAAPDPQVYSGSTLQGILMAAYRANSPVIGYSAAYVKAGALAAVFSTPEQIGRQAAELILNSAGQPRRQLPAPQYPKYFSIEVNRNVARSFDLVPEEDARLMERLKRGEGSES
jgi:ABC-type uncharacterized transport system substrate-binding protein